ncbi:MAG: radical SAM protein [bacterium]|nr:radical SAM protein [bacterium]
MNCNFFCKHCGSSAGRKFFKGELTTKEIKDVFKDVADHYNPKKIMIAITGGEPLVRKDLFEVMEYVSSLGFPWGMVTNGFLVTKEIVQKMKKAGMRTVVVSIDGIGVIHDTFRGMKNAYEHAIRAVKLLAEEKFLDDLQITTTIHKGNFHLLDKMYDEFSKLPITSWRVFNVDPIGRAEDNKNLLLDGPQLKKLLQFIKQKRKKSKIDVTYGCAGFLGIEFEDEVRDHLFICNTGINTASILYNGDIFICPNVPRRKELVQGNVRKDSFSEVWEKKFQLFRDKNRTKSKKCELCVFWEDCLGGSFHLWDFEKKQPKFCHYEMVR